MGPTSTNSATYMCTAASSDIPALDLHDPDFALREVNVVRQVVYVNRAISFDERSQCRPVFHNLLIHQAFDAPSLRVPDLLPSLQVQTSNVADVEAGLGNLAEELARRPENKMTR